MKLTISFINIKSNDFAKEKPSIRPILEVESVFYWLHGQNQSVARTNKNPLK